MNEKQIDAFINELTDGGSESDSSDSETTDLRKLWGDLGDLPEEPLSNSRMVSEFQVRLAAYREGWDAARGELESQKSPVESRSVLRSLFLYGLVAAFAVGIFLLGILSSGWSEGVDRTALELAQTREALALSLLSQDSAPRRMAALSEASKVQSPSRELRDAVLWTLDNDASVNVRLAAVEAVGALSSENGVDLLVGRLQAQASPLVKMEIIRIALQYGSEGDRQALIQRLDTVELPDSLQAYLKEGTSKI